MKKTISFLLVVILVIGMLGCSENSNDNITAEQSEASSVESNSLYYEYAVMHDDDFWKINMNWRDDGEYYYLADVDHDGNNEMIVKIGCGVGIYKEVDGRVEEVFYDTLPESSGSVNYWVARHKDKDYIVYSSASSSEYLVLNTLSGTSLTPVKTSLIVNTDYMINDEAVSVTEYSEYIESITYPDGMTINDLK